MQMLKRLNNILLNEQPDIICLQEFTGDNSNLYNEFFHPPMASKFLDNNIQGDKIRFIHLNKIKILKEKGNVSPDPFRAIPSIDDLKSNNKIFILVDDGSPPGNVTYIRADKIDYENLQELKKFDNDSKQQMKIRYLRTIVPIKINDMSILAHITNVHDKLEGVENKYYLDNDILQSLLTTKVDDLNPIVPDSFDEIAQKLNFKKSYPQLILNKRQKVGQLNKDMYIIEENNHEKINIKSDLFDITGSVLDFEFFKN